MKQQSIQIEVNEQKEAFVVYNNTDGTQGRGEQYPSYICEKEATARRKAKGAYVMGSDCPYKKMNIFRIGYTWYGPISIKKPSEEEKIEEQKIQETIAKKLKLDEIVKKMKESGFSDEDIKAVASK